MARKKRRSKKTVRTIHRAQPLTSYTPKAIRKIKQIARKKGVAAPLLSKREPTKRAIVHEVKKIRQKRVLPILSKISPYSCKRKRAKARHDYFSMRAAGAGGNRLPGPHKNRFTVRCT